MGISIVKEYCFLSKMQIDLNQPGGPSTLNHMVTFLFEIKGPQREPICQYHETYIFAQTDHLLSIPELSVEHLNSIKERIAAVKKEQVGYVG